MERKRNWTDDQITNRYQISLCFKKKKTPNTLMFPIMSQRRCAGEKHQFLKMDILDQHQDFVQLREKIQIEK